MAWHNPFEHRKVQSAFSAKMPLVNLELIEGQTRSKSSQNNIFHGFISNPSSSDIFSNYDQL